MLLIGRLTRQTVELPGRGLARLQGCRLRGMGLPCSVNSAERCKLLCRGGREITGQISTVDYGINQFGGGRE
jgi:hypothetical protein